MPSFQPVAIDGLGSGVVVLSTGGQVNYPPIVAEGSLWVPVTDLAKVLRVDIATGALQAEIEAGRQVRPCCGANSVAYAGGLVWVAQGRNQAVLVIDPTTNRVTETIPVGLDVYGIAADDESVWVTAFEADAVVRIDIESGEIVATIEGVFKPTAVVVGAGAVWAVEHRRGTLVRIDPATNEIVAKVDLGAVEGHSAGGENAVFAHGSVWVATNAGQAVVAVDPATNEQTVIPFPGAYIMRVTVGDEGIWVTYNAEGRDLASDFVRVDPTTHVVTTFEFENAWIPFEDEGVMWLIVADPGGDLLLRIELEPA